ncbi:MAG: hypothetical protein A2086_07330 [Spirochaetes bacterium GWD1_27_9]|nr:MAG: hypothetical protein A2Z98_07505 [Spirochaetes bacterium GWB1_27_13]OHD20378.1 MAG: hypothetical protein A2Y34_07870 [Spirochaetes bacterium GWC1_27_15]OHD29105.1 MAG: hypothetical protein A2086_07330 [Spirochaetes bacterium GWD1_27_9]
MTKKLTFIEEAEFKGFRYRPNGILGNGFYGNGFFISLTEMEKMSKTATQPPFQGLDKSLINTDFFIECEKIDHFYTHDIVKLFAGIKQHQIHNFFNKYKDVFMSQKLFVMINRKRVFTKEAIKFIYNKLVKKEEPPVKKRGRKAVKI